MNLENSTYDKIATFDYSTAMDAVDGRAKDYAARHKTTYGEGLIEICAADPELSRRYDREVLGLPADADSDAEFSLRETRITYGGRQGRETTMTGPEAGDEIDRLTRELMADRNADYVACFHAVLANPDHADTVRAYAQ